MKRSIIATTANKYDTALFLIGKLDLTVDTTTEIFKDFNSGRHEYNGPNLKLVLKKLRPNRYTAIIEQWG